MTTSLLRMQHTSLQFSDSKVQQRHDVEQLFALGSAFPIKTGTESGAEDGNDNDNFLKQFAKKYNHVLHFMRSNWVAIDRSIIKAGSVKKGSIWVADNDLVAGRGADSAAATIRFDHTDSAIGRINVATAHYPLQGARPGDVNHRWNQLYADKIAAWMQDNGKGSALAFVNGDFNMHDERTDFALGRNFTSMADELHRYQNTGHGPIDGMCSYDADGRVKAHRWSVLDDSEMRAFSDHYVCRGVWEVRHLNHK